MASRSRCYCAGCGKELIGISYPHGGKSYCLDCHEAILSELLKAEEQKTALYNYIRELFNIGEIPEMVLMAIDRELKSGKKIKGIQSTIKYYYEVEGHEAKNIDYLSFVIKDQYDNARKYSEYIKAQQEHNSKIDLNVPPVVIKIDPKKNYNGNRKKTSCNIEDL